jgi:2-dehydropantoate 2-reductase
MHVAVLGAGAVGTFVAAQFAKSCDVTLLDRRAGSAGPQQIRVIGEFATAQVVGVTPEIDDIRSADLLIVATKAGQLAELLGKLNGSRTPMLLCQNGLGINELAISLMASAPLGRAFLWAGFTRESDYVVRCNGVARIGLASLRSFDVEQVSMLLSRAGLLADLIEDPNRGEWEKAMWNLGVNALCAIVNAENNGVVLESPPLVSLLRALIGEAEAVAARMGHVIHATDSVLAHTRKTRSNRNSMVADLRAGRSTEIEELNGYVVRMSSQYNVSAPYNEFAYALVKHLDATNRKATG